VAEYQELFGRRYSSQAVRRSLTSSCYEGYVCLYSVDRPLLPSPSTGKTNLSGTVLRAVALTLYLVFV
jgi:hypothetical protein